MKTADGQFLGTIESTAEDAVVIRAGDEVLALSTHHLTLDHDGQLVVRATMEQIEQAMSARQARDKLAHTGCRVQFQRKCNL